MRYTLMVTVVMPDGSVDYLPALRFYPGDVDGKNAAVPATFATEHEAKAWAMYCLPDRTSVKEEP